MSELVFETRTFLTCTEGVDVLVKLEAHDGSVVVDDVCLTVPGARHHLLPAVSLVGGGGRHKHPGHDFKNL